MYIKYTVIWRCFTKYYSIKAINNNKKLATYWNKARWHDRLNNNNKQTTVTAWNKAHEEASLYSSIISACYTGRWARLKAWICARSPSANEETANTSAQHPHCMQHQRAPVYCALTSARTARTIEPMKENALLFFFFLKRKLLFS